MCASETARACRRVRIPEAMYESRAKTLSQRVPDEPDARLDLLLALTEALRDAVADPGSTEDRVAMLPGS